MTKRFRFLFVLALAGIATWLLWPTINWYFILDQATKDRASLPRTEIRKYAQVEAEKAVLELIRLDKQSPETALPAKFDFVLERAREAYVLSKREVPSSWTVGNLLRAFVSQEALEKAIENHYRADVLAVKSQKSRIIQLGLDLAGGLSVVLQADTTRLKERLGGVDPSPSQVSEALDLAVESLKNRVDAFGISEPSIRKDADPTNPRVYIEIPGDADPESVNRFILGGGSLQLQLVDDDATSKFITYQEQYKATNLLTWIEGNEIPADMIPAGSKVRPYVQKDEYEIDFIERYIVTKEGTENIVDGNYITEARVTSDPTSGAPNVNFVLNAEGAEKMRVLSRDNKGKSLAIVLEGQVRAYARIVEEISSQIRITGFNKDEAFAIERVLKTGALPLDFSVESQQQVGASLGADAIQQGAMAAAVGFGAVLLFMILYYVGAGITANIALLLNIFFLISVLGALNFTLTLTSIAGLILTIGMAVDANVIIYERVKEELRSGKARAAAVKAGYGKAFWTIMDSNITTIIASVLLAWLGTGPIRGFAVTLTAGIVTSMFSALFVTRLLQDFGTEQLGRTRMSIAWRLK